MKAKKTDKNHQQQYQIETHIE